MISSCQLLAENPYKETIKSLLEARTPQEDMQARAKKTYQLGNSQVFKQRVALFQKQLSNDSEKKIMPKEEGNIILFASSSMPMSTLRTYAADLERVGGIMLVRGFKEGMQKVSPTLEWLSEVLKVDTNCKGAFCPQRQVKILVDPKAFSEHQITEVPAVMSTKVDLNAPYCERSNDLINPFITVGDTSLLGHLEAQHRHKPSAFLKAAIAKLEGRA